MSVISRPRILTLSSIALLCLAQSGCDDRSSTTVYEQQAHIKQLQRQLQKEQSAKEHAARERMLAEHTTRWWQGVVAWVSASAVLMLVVGAALGSRARKDAQANRERERTGAATP